MDKRYNWMKIENMFTEEQKMIVKRDGRSKGQRYLAEKMKVSVHYMNGLFEMLGIKVDKYQANKRKSIKLPGSKR